MTFVIDTSFIGAKIIPDEKNEKIDRMYLQLGDNDEKIVPQLFVFEIVNLFMNLIRRKRCTYKEACNLLQVISGINFTVDSETGPAYLKMLLDLCNEHNLSSYDAAYLELALRKKAVLCTMDDKLKRAAKKCGVAVLK